MTPSEASRTAVADQVTETGLDELNPEDVEARISWWQRVLAQPVSGVGAALAAIVIAFSIIAPHTFLTGSNLQSLALDNATLVIMAMALAMVIISGGFDLSGGSVIAISQVAAGETFNVVDGTNAGFGGILLGLAAAMLTGTFCGTVNGVIVTRLAISPFIATLATSGIALGVAEVITNGVDFANVPAGLTQNIGLRNLAGIPVLVIIAAAVVLLTGYLLGRTRFGRRVYAIGSDRTAASRAGISVARYQIGVYALAGTAYGLVGFLDMARLSTSTITGYSDIALLAITAVAIGGGSLFGGTGTALGALIGVSIPAVLNNGLAITGAPSYYEEIGVGIALVLAVYADQIRRSVARLN